ncbi:hypothetical protein Patl1_10714 [Pistacia atlantica]|uniref:Uncharacterized protein n=1 Tax=Pistacia atlantica TaxID=434234 RepID=A0ACC1AA98_9ROSI|nr:hypothetical protein Patl1_10714 [Pistacia atlantica]
MKFSVFQIDSLEAKVAELESCNQVRDKNELLAIEPKQPISEKLEPMLDDELKSYTPYIKYTKLEFKVDTFFAVGSPLGVFLALQNIRIGIACPPV